MILGIELKKKGTIDVIAEEIHFYAQLRAFYAFVLIKSFQIQERVAHERFCFQLLLGSPHGPALFSLFCIICNTRNCFKQVGNVRKRQEIFIF